jgi:hypothetical protein
MIAGTGLLTLAFLSSPALASSFVFSTGIPDGLIGTLSRPAGAGHIQTETADDFILPQATTLTNATFYGLLPTGAPLSSITRGNRILSRVPR